MTRQDTPTGAPPVVLLVEDDPLVRTSLAEALSEAGNGPAGFEMLEAADAPTALALLGRRSDIVAMLTDIDLAGAEDGFALARSARELRPDMVVVTCSGLVPEASPSQMVAGARHLAKPFNPDLMAAVIRSLLPPASGRA